MTGSARNRVLVLFDFGTQRRGYFLHLSLVFLRHSYMNVKILVCRSSAFKRQADTTKSGNCDSKPTVTFPVVWITCPEWLRRWALHDSKSNTQPVAPSRIIAVIQHQLLHCVSQKTSPTFSCNSNTRCWILIFFGRNVSQKIGNWKTM